MQIYATRVDAHRYSTLVERDGVRLQVPGYGFMRAFAARFGPLRRRGKSAIEPGVLGQRGGRSRVQWNGAD
jgi:hypothetical protein